MFEKDAKEYREKGKNEGYYLVTEDMDQEGLDYIIDECFKDGAEFGYNKANEWHYVKDGDLPKDFGYYLVALKSVAYKGFVFEVVYFTGCIFTKEGEISDNVYAWKEIVLPEPPKEGEYK